MMTLKEQVSVTCCSWSSHAPDLYTRVKHNTSRSWVGLSYISAVVLFFFSRAKNMWKYFVLFFINHWSSCELLQGPAMLWGLSSWQERQLLRGQTRAHFLPYRPAEIFYSQTDFHSFSWAGRHCSLVKHNTSEDRLLSCSQIYYLKTESWSVLG